MSPLSSSMATRKSSRHMDRLKSESILTEVSPTSSGGNANSKEQGRRPRKKSKGQNVASSKEVEGKEGQLMEMPVEILLEIFGQVDPIDLLYISWTSKDLRNFVRSSNTVWNLAYENLAFHIRPPLCPDHIDVGQYTNYLFGDRCQFCGALPKSPILHETAFVRVCSKCARLRFRSLLDTKIDKTVGDLCQAWQFKCPNMSGCRILRAEYKLYQHELAQAEKENRSQEYIQHRKAIVAARKNHARQLPVWRYENEEHEAKLRHIIETLGPMAVEGLCSIARKLVAEGWR